MAMFPAVDQCLRRHYGRVHDTGPNCERDEAAVCLWISRRRNQIDAQDHVDAANHLEVILSLAPVPDPAGRSHQAKRVDQTE